MKQIEKTASATNFTAINLGKLNELGDYLLELAPEIKTVSYTHLTLPTTSRV